MVSSSMLTAYLDQLSKTHEIVLITRAKTGGRSPECMMRGNPVNIHRMMGEAQQQIASDLFQRVAQTANPGIVKP